MAKMIFSSVNSIRAVFEDLKRIKETEQSLEQRLESDLESQGCPEEYTIF